MGGEVVAGSHLNDGAKLQKSMENHKVKPKVKPKNKIARIVIVDDHPVIRGGLVHVFRGEADLTVCGEAEDGHQALLLVQIANPDLLIIGMLHQEAHGLELIKYLHAACPKVKILVLSMQDESVNAERAINAGASGYISKEESIPKILEAVRRVMRGEIYLSQRIAAQMVATLAGRPPVRVGSVLADLSVRELEIFGLLGDGLGRRQIAERLHLDVNTVETYRTRLREKLHIKDAGDLRLYAVQLKRAKNLDHAVVPEYFTAHLPQVSSAGALHVGLFSV